MEKKNRLETFKKATKKRRYNLKETGKVRIDVVVSVETNDILSSIKTSEGLTSKGEAIDKICEYFKKHD